MRARTAPYLLHLAHALDLLALPAAVRLVADPLPLLAAPVSLALYAGVVYKEVLAALAGETNT
jgi:hypothetical protein